MSDIKFIQTISDMISSNMFDSDSNKWLVKTIKEYYLKYKKQPTLEVLKYKIEEIDWDCLQIANLGKGQIQIRDAKKPIKKYNGSREEWLKELKIRVLLFLDKQIKKRKLEKILWEKSNNEKDKRSN